VKTPATTNDRPSQGPPTAEARPKRPVRPAAAPAPAVPRTGPRSSSGLQSCLSGLGSVVRGGGVRFYVCLGCLLISAATMDVLARRFQLYFQKQPVPLKRPLAVMDQSKLLPQYRLHTRQPEALSEDAVESLGTREYLSWTVVDLDRQRDDPACVAHLLVSYYTGKPNLVPHVPEECLQAAGAALVGVPRTVRIPVPGVGAPDGRVPVRVCDFESVGPDRASLPGVAGQVDTFKVLYFFYVNGEYKTTRDEVRLRLSNLFDRYAYYTKVEVRFTDYSFQQRASEEASIAALGKLLRKIMPVLLEDHLVDWEALNSVGTDEAAGHAQG
jgi:hypothetical protein